MATSSMISTTRQAAYGIQIMLLADTVVLYLLFDFCSLYQIRPSVRLPQAQQKERMNEYLIHEYLIFGYLIS